MECFQNAVQENRGVLIGLADESAKAVTTDKCDCHEKDVRQKADAAIAITRGMRRKIIGSSPCASSTRTSPPAFMIPNSVAIALPPRTMRTKLAKRGPSSLVTTSTSNCPAV